MKTQKLENILKGVKTWYVGTPKELKSFPNKDYLLVGTFSEVFLLMGTVAAGVSFGVQDAMPPNLLLITDFIYRIYYQYHSGEELENLPGIIGLSRAAYQRIRGKTGSYKSHKQTNIWK
jgi:hypothetical protein